MEHYPTMCSVCRCTFETKPLRTTEPPSADESGTHKPRRPYTKQRGPIKEIFATRTEPAVVCGWRCTSLPRRRLSPVSRGTVDGSPHVLASSSTVLLSSSFLARRRGLSLRPWRVAVARSEGLVRGMGVRIGSLRPRGSQHSRNRSM